MKIIKIQHCNLTITMTIWQINVEISCGNSKFGKISYDD